MSKKFEQQLQDVISEQYGEIDKLNEQIAEMQLLLDQANEKLKVHFSKVNSSFEPTEQDLEDACTIGYVMPDDLLLQEKLIKKRMTEYRKTISNLQDIYNARTSIGENVC